MFYLQFIIFVASSVICGNGAKILAVFPVPSLSHQVVFRPLTQELARRGHEVVVITPDPAFPKGQIPANLTEIDVHDISYDVWQKEFVTLSTGSQTDIYKQMDKGTVVILKVFFEQLKTNEVKNIIFGGEKYDLLILEACVRPAIFFSHIFKAPVISVSSYGAVIGYDEVVGAPIHPFLYPIMFNQRLYNLTFREKINELKTYVSFSKMISDYRVRDSAIIKDKFGQDVPSLSKFFKNVNALFLNVHPIFEGNRPVPPSVIHMGGIHQKPPKELPQELNSYLDSSEYGVIYISFGTNADPANFPPELIQMFIRVLSQLPYDVVWKWNRDELPGRTENIRIAKWLPQSDLLRHPKIKLFITQGGLQSTDEAINAGVPLVGIPMLGDQWYNTEKYVHLNIGKKLDVESLTEEEFRSAITNVIDDKSYKNNIMKLGALMRDQPQKPLERTVWWTEHVLRHPGAAHLRAPAAYISMAEYLELKLVFTLLVALLVILSVVLIALYSLFRFLTRSIFTSSKLKRS